MSATATAPSAVPACRPVKRGFGKLVCLKCSEATCHLLDVEDFSIVRCMGCEEEYDLAEVRDLIAGWSRLLAFIDTAPVVAE